MIEMKRNVVKVLGSVLIGLLLAPPAVASVKNLLEQRVSLLEVKAENSGAGPGVWFVSGTGDDSADCFTWGTACSSVQAAVNKVPVNTRGLVEVSGGVFMHSSPIMIQDRHVVIRGQGMATTLRTLDPVDGLVTFAATNQSIVGAGIENLSVEGYNSGLTGIKLTRSGPFEVTMFYLENVFVNGFQTQMLVDSPSKLTVTNSAFEFGWGSKPIGIRMNTGNAVLISTWFEQTAIGLDLHNDSHVQAMQATVATNVTTSVKLTGGYGYTPTYEEV
jgi:hypothetical protein